MRTNLKIFRIKQKLKQDEIAEKIGCTRQSYCTIENGTRNGSDRFWNGLQKAFNIDDSEMWMLKKNE